MKDSLDLIKDEQLINSTTNLSQTTNNKYS